jgi:hypothetical protein
MQKVLAGNRFLGYPLAMTATKSTINVAEFIEILKGLPQDLIVQCLEEKSAYWETYTVWKNFDKDDFDVRAGFLEIGCK